MVENQLNFLFLSVEDVIQRKILYIFVNSLFGS